MAWIENQRKFIEGLFRDKLSLWNGILKERGYLWFDNKWEEYREIGRLYDQKKFSSVNLPKSHRNPRRRLMDLKSE